MPNELVVLVPGFLGFSRFGMFSYYADRVPAVIGALIQHRWTRHVPVLGCGTIPTSGLRDRVWSLARTIQGKMDDKNHYDTFYLVGHSTGGVDAQLLKSGYSFPAAPWTAEEQATLDTVRAAIKSVVTISAPHYGTYLASSPLAALIMNPLMNLDALPLLGRDLFFLMRLIKEDSAQVGELLNHGWDTLPDASRFVLSVLLNHELIQDLTPASMEKIRTDLAGQDLSWLTCFLTGAEVQTGSGRVSDPFWADLDKLCGTMPAGATLPADVQKNIADLGAVAPTNDLWVRSNDKDVLPFDDALNDGVVNTSRQMIPGARLGGIVIGDHADVLGHYDRKDIAGQSTNTGLFRSGAGFGDQAFFKLYDRVVSSLV